MGSERKQGLPVPWLYLRARVAEAWGVPPWDVDDAPWSEVDLAVELLHLSGRLRPGRG